MSVAGEPDRDDVGRRPAAELHFLDQRRRQRQRGAVEFGAGAEIARGSPALRAKALVADRWPPPSIGTTRDLAWHSAGSSQRRPVLRRSALATAVLAAATERDMATPLRSVEKVLPSQYQRWSAWRPPIITADRSLPATATLRLPGCTALQQVAERRHAQMTGRDGVGRRRTARHALVLGAIDGLVAARCDRSNQ